ncbi:MAG TPA: DUF4259 domain-containing protein [Longimicrobiaceae bacterium]|nr:DUF4259 domain-containing protein [Longimicrobiaceae bacterium]
MGAWGAGAFDNDDALDWLDDLLDGDGAELLRDALSAAAEADGYLEAPDAASALAAAEVVAALAGRPSSALPDEAAGWVRAQSGGAKPWMLDFARRALERVARDSELRELWLESGDAGEWEATLVDLRERLG